MKTITTRSIDNAILDKMQDRVTKAYNIIQLIKTTTEYEQGHMRDVKMFSDLGFEDSVKHHTYRAEINRAKMARLIQYFNNTVNEISL